MLKLGVPSKGRLMEKTFDWFAERGVNLGRAGSDRDYAGVVSGISGVELVLLSASEIPRELAAGRIHLGVTGTDLIFEKIPASAQRVSVVELLGFGGADLILAVPDSWVDCASIDDLDEIAAQYRANHGRRLRIATKYHNLVRQFLRDQAIADYQLVDSQGATEGTVKNETAEAIADITSTGATIRANGLKVLEGSLIHASQAALVRSHADQWPGSVTRAWDELREMLGVK